MSPGQNLESEIFDSLSSCLMQFMCVKKPQSDCIENISDDDRVESTRLGESIWQIFGLGFGTRRVEIKD